MSAALGRTAMWTREPGIRPLVLHLLILLLILSEAILHSSRSPGILATRKSFGLEPTAMSAALGGTIMWTRVTGIRRSLLHLLILSEAVLRSSRSLGIPAK